MPAGISFWNADVVKGEHTAAEIDRAMREVEIAKKVGEVLELHYKGHHFLVEVYGGCVVIRHPLLPAAWGEVIKLKDMANDPAMRAVMRAGGDILERFNLPRTGFVRDKWMEAREKYKHVRYGIRTVLDLSTGKIKRVLPPELAR